MGVVALVISGVLFVPYVGWGLYTLRLRFRYHEDLPFALEGFTLVGLFLFWVFEVKLMNYWMGTGEFSFIFAVLGLAVSSTALYGHIVISVASQLIVDMVMPGDRRITDEPHYAPAEALERQGDYEGAAREYMVIARVFPKDPTAAIRAGDNFMKVGRSADAAPWFERALKYAPSPQQTLQVANRLSEIYCRHLERPDDARRVLQTYVDRFPEAEYTASVRQRIANLAPAGQENLENAPELGH